MVSHPTSLHHNPGASPRRSRSYRSGCADDPVAAGALRGVERLVGAIDQRLERRRVLGKPRDADADRLREELVIRADGMDLDELLEPLRDRHRLLDAGFNQEQDEFLAAVARDEIDFAQVTLELLRDVPEHDIPDEMAVRVILLFEVVEIGHQDGAREPMAR